MSGKPAEPFSDYKPSRNAYTNFLNASGGGSARSDVKVIKFTPKGLPYLWMPSHDL